MAGAYLGVSIFAAMALLVPALALLLSKLMRPESENNEVETQVFESAELGIGQRAGMMNEYVPYFSVFLAFGIICAVVVVWSFSARQLDFASNFHVELLLVLGFLLTMFVLALHRMRDD